MTIAEGSVDCHWVANQIMLPGLQSGTSGSPSMCSGAIPAS
jgi:hypothetical protein